jgi:hypothetical protein
VRHGIEITNLGGYTEPDDSELPRTCEEAGATWWLENVHSLQGTLDEMMARVAAGPAG